MNEVFGKIHADLLVKIQAEPEKRFQILVRFPKEWYEKIGQYVSKELLFDSIKALFGFWDRRFGNIVFLDFIEAENLGLYYVVLEIKGRLIPTLEKFPDVEWIAEDMKCYAIPLNVDPDGISGSNIFQPSINQTVPYLGFDKIHQDERFIDKGLGKDGPPMGIADTGGPTDSSGSKWRWLYEHPEKYGTPDQGKYRVLESKDFTGSPYGPVDDVGHDSHCVNIMASAGEKYYGCVPQGRLYSAKVLLYGSGYTSWIINGINWLVGKGCKVINLSLGSEENTDGTDELSVACDKAWDLDVYVSIAAGNSGTKNRPYCEGTLGAPACSKKCAVSGATSGVKSQPEQTQYWSSRPPTKDGRKFELKYVVAPGLKINGYDGRMDGQSGTSFATPFHSALAWVLRIIHPDWTNEQVWQAIKNTAAPLGYKDAYGKEEGFCLEGYGRIDAWAAYNYTGITPPECEEGSVEVIEYCPDGVTWRRRKVCVSGKWKEESQTCPEVPPECEEGSVEIIEYCPDGQTWKRRKVCRSGKWVEEIQPCPEVPPAEKMLCPWLDFENEDPAVVQKHVLDTHCPKCPPLPSTGYCPRWLRSLLGCEIPSD